jgi:hypothetical protein
MKRYAMLTATLVLGAVLAAPANASGGHDSGERSDRAAERAERDRMERAERAERDAAKREEREIRDTLRDTERSIKEASEDRDRSDSEDHDQTDSVDADRDDSSGSNSGSEPKTETVSSGSNSGSSGSSEAEDDDNYSGSGSSSDLDDDDDDEDDNDSDDNDDSDDEGGEKGRLSYDDNGQLYRDRELVVLLKDNAELGRVEGLGFSVIESRPMRRDAGVVVRIGVPADMAAREALDRLQVGLPDAPSAYNHVYTPSGETLTGNALAPTGGTYPGAQAGLVAVIDGFSGGEVMHHEVKTFVRKRAAIPHGDHVVSVLVNDLLALGYATPERLLAADVVEQANGTAPSASIIGLIDALDWASAEGAQVINISLSGPPNKVLETVVNEIARDGTLIVAAVGNSGPATRPGYPAAYDSVMGITAVDSAGAPYIYAARGPQVELSAEAVSIGATSSGESLSGTSFAAPRVTALAATLIRDQSAGDVRTGLHRVAWDLGAPGRDEVFGFGAVPAPPGPALLAVSEDLQKKSTQRE